MTSIRRPFHVLVGVLFILALLAAAAVYGAPSERIIYVCHDATGANDGSSWADAYTGLQDALAEARTGDEIWVARGVYYPAPDAADRNATFELVDGVALYGGFAGTETEREQRNWLGRLTVLSGDLDRNDETDEHGVVTDPANIVGDNAYHVVTGSGIGATAVLDGFVVTAGLADGSGTQGVGGGMNNAGSSPSLFNVTFRGNRATWCGGMRNYESSPALTNVVFFGNQASVHGGGVCNDQNSHPTLTAVTFIQNLAGSAGGMHNHASSPTLTGVTFSHNGATIDGGGMRNAADSRPTLTDVTFSRNHAGSGGGGMFNGHSSPALTGVTFDGNTASLGGGMRNSGSSPMLINVVFTDNRASQGGGMNNWEGSPTLINVVFSGNTGGVGGGGMYNDQSDPALINVTFSGNAAGAGSGGGLFNFQSSNPTLVNTILWGNAAQSGGQQIHNEDGSAPSVTYSLVQGGHAGEGNIDADPLFVDPISADEAPTTDGDYRLSAGSPAIDAGNNNAVTVDTDLDGYARIADGTGDGNVIVDMGAYEFPVGFRTVYLPLVLSNR